MNRAEQTQATRKLILDSAMMVFGEKDYTGGSISDISTNAGISKGIIYHYFHNKEDLYLECVNICFESLCAHLSTFTKPTGSIATVVGSYIQYRHQFFEENPNIKNVFFNVILGKYHGLSTAILSKRTDLDAINLDFFKDILSSITFRDGVTQQDAIHLLTVLLGSSATMPQTQQDQYTPHTFMMEQEKFIVKTLEIIFHGIGEEKNDRNT